MKTSEQLKSIRAALGAPDGKKMTQDQLSKILDTSVTNITRWENGISPVAIYAEKINDMYEKVQALRSMPERHEFGDEIPCGFCTGPVHFQSSMFDKDRGQLLCKKCYYALNRG